MPQPNPYDSPKSESLGASSDDTTHGIAESRFDSLAGWALALAVLNIVCPLVGDVLVVLVLEQRIGEIVVVFVADFAIVSTPAVVSWRRHLTQPGVWRGRGVLIAATVILSLQVIWATAIVIHLLVQ